MRDPLTTRVRTLRRRLRRRAIVVGALSILAIVLGVALAVGLLDYVIRFEDAGIRYIASIAVIVAFGATTIRYWIIPLRKRMSDVGIARRIERRETQLGDLLSNAVAFLTVTDESNAGSSALLRRAVVARATAASDDFDWRSFVPRRPLRRALVVVTIPVAILAGLLFAAPLNVRTGALRIVRPLGDDHWPREHHLAVLNAPSRVAKGATIEIKVVDQSGNCPEDMQLHLRTRVGGETKTEQREMIVTDDAAFIRLNDVTESFEFRAIGGDDQTMAWRAVEVVDSPRVVETQITLHPPNYTGYAPRNSGEHIRALAGTRISVAGRASLPIRAARVVLDDGETIEATVSDDQLQFSIAESEWMAKETTTYRFELDGEDAVEIDAAFDEKNDRFALRVEPDPAPSVSIETPPSDVYATSNAVTTVHVLAKDNLAIQTVALNYSRSDRTEEGEQRLVIWADEKVSPILDGEKDPLRAKGDRRVVEYAWDLASLNLPVGAEVLLSAEASDYRPGVGQVTVPKRIHIVSSQEMESRLAEQNATILADLSEALRLERDARRDVQAFEVQLQAVGSLTANDLDGFQAIETTQRRIEHILTDEVDGAPQRIQSLLDELNSNRVESPVMSERISDISRVLDRITRGALPKIRRGLLMVSKSPAMYEAEIERGPVDLFANNAIADVMSGQEEVIRGLEDLVGDMEQWADYRQFTRDIGQMLADQRELSEAIEREFGIENSVLHSDPTHRDAARNESAARQRELARRLGVTVSAMQDAINDLDQRDPAVAESLSDSLEAVKRHGISGAMRDASRDVEENRIQRALDRQAGIVTGLEEMLRALRDQKEGSLENLPAKMREAEAELARMREKLADLQDEAESTGNVNETTDDEARTRLLKQVQKNQKSTAAIANEIERLARRLKRLTAERASRSAEQAAGRLADQQDAYATEPNPGETEKGDNIPLGDAIQDARRDLKNAQMQLAERRREVERDFAAEKQVEIAASIETLRENQQRLLDETIRIELVATSAKGIQGPNERIASLLAEEQRLLRTELSVLTESSGVMRVLIAALDSAGEAMERAADRLSRRDFGDVTQRAERLAVDRLEQILDAFAQSETTSEGDAGGDAAGGGEQGGDDEHAQPKPTLALAELKLLRSMQEEIRDRTATLESERGADQEWTKEDRHAFDAIADEQAKLADLVFLSIERNQNGEYGGDSKTKSDGASGEPAPIDEGIEKESDDDVDLPPLDVTPIYPPVSSIDAETRVTGRLAIHARIFHSLTRYFLNPRLSGDRRRPTAIAATVLAELRSTIEAATGENFGAPPDSPPTKNPILRIGERMQEASQVIEKGDARGTASKLQARVLADLDRFIENASARNRNQPRMNSKTQNPKQRRDPKNAKPDSDSQPQGASNQANGEPASTQNPGASTPAERRDMRGLLKNLWGRLPDRAREQLIESPPEEFLPEYELEIEQYYRRLAEESAEAAP